MLPEISQKAKKGGGKGWIIPDFLSSTPPGQAKVAQNCS
jgi:hypothetical protein